MVNKLYKIHLFIPYILGKKTVKTYIKSNKNVKTCRVVTRFARRFLQFTMLLPSFFEINEPYLYPEEHQIYLINLQDVEEYAEF